MVKIISIQRIAGRGVVQFVRNGTATALRFDARLSDAEVRKLVEPAVISEIDQLRLRARELNIKGENRPDEAGNLAKEDHRSGDGGG